MLREIFSAQMPHFSRQTTRKAAAILLAGILLVGCESSQQPPVAPTPAAIDTSVPPADPPPPASYVPRPQGSLVFTKDVAPIIYQKCAGCHHAGEIGPFPLVSYADLRKRPKQIVDVITRRIMPPWPAAPGYCHFDEDRSLTVDQIGLITQWFNEGGPEGNPSDLPPLPDFPTGWKLGTPDLVLTMPEPFVLPVQGRDTYRKFVLPVPITERKYVRAYEFDPGNRRVVHHAMIRIDSTGWSRYLDKQNPLPGFEGTMMGGDRSPDGLLMGWAPGARPQPPNGPIAWAIDPGTDFVLELHLLPSGKPETIRSSLALISRPLLLTPIRVSFNCRMGRSIFRQAKSPTLSRTNTCCRLLPRRSNAGRTPTFFVAICSFTPFYRTELGNGSCESRTGISIGRIRTPTRNRFRFRAERRCGCGSNTTTRPTIRGTRTFRPSASITAAIPKMKWAK